MASELQGSSSPAPSFIPRSRFPVPLSPPALTRMRGRPGSLGSLCSDSFNQHFRIACKGCSSSSVSQYSTPHDIPNLSAHLTQQQRSTIAANRAAARQIRHERTVAAMSAHPRVDLPSLPDNIAPFLICYTKCTYTAQNAFRIWECCTQHRHFPLQRSPHSATICRFEHASWICT